MLRVSVRRIDGGEEGWREEGEKTKGAKKKKKGKKKKLLFAVEVAHQFLWEALGIA